MIILFYLLAAVCFSIYACLPFWSLEVKWHYIIGITIGIIANFGWITLSRLVSADQVITAGVIWDLVITACFIFIPVLFFNNSISYKEIVGFSAIFGILLWIKL